MSHLKSFITELLFPIIMGLVIAKLLTVFVLQFNVVNGQSMEPTLQHKDYLVTEKLSYLFKDPKKGDIVIVKPPNEDKFLIKRVIGVAGDTLTFVPQDGETNEPSKLLINGKVINEDYINGEMQIPAKAEFVIGEEEVFLLGDNRNNSLDSRYYGAFNKSDLRGKVFLELSDTFQTH